MYFAVSAGNDSDTIGALMLDDSGSLEPGGVELNMSEVDWFHEAMEIVMVAGEDEPTLTEALNGGEPLGMVRCD